MSSRNAALPSVLSAESHEHRLERRLPSGRSLHLRTDATGEEIELRSARGELDLRIVLTDAGPVVTLRCARLEVESPDVAFRCHNFDVQTTGDLRLKSEGQVAIQADELRATTEHDIHLNGAYVRLNCTPDLEVPVQIPGFPSVEAAAGSPGPTAPGDCSGHGHEETSEP
jgi:hypothetical protein